MNKAGRKHWYSQVSRPAPGGKYMRYYEVQCRRCGQKASFHANNMTDDALRKIFMRQNWKIGRAVHQHTCPGCEAPPEPKPKPKQNGAITAAAPIAIEAKSISEQAGDWAAKFWANLNDLGRGILLQAIVNAMTDEDRLNLSIMALDARETNLPIESSPAAAPPMIAEPEPTPEPAPIPPPDSPAQTARARSEPNGSDDDVADWWRELMQK